MNNLWLKIKLWTKIAICSFVAIYLLVFIIKNTGPEITFWYWYNREIKASMLLLVSVSFLTGILVAILARMMFKTARQISAMRNAARTEKLEREVADMKAKAAMLQTKTAPQGPSASSSDEIPLA
jgi:uncharacterized integral membrane protein